MAKKGTKYKVQKLPYTKKEVEGFIEAAMGSITQAAGNIGVPYSTFYAWMERYDIKAYPHKIKRRVALMALDRAKYLSLTPSNALAKKGEKPSVVLLQDILKKWGKYIEYEDPEKEISSNLAEDEDERARRHAKYLDSIKEESSIRMEKVKADEKIRVVRALGEKVDDGNGNILDEFDEFLRWKEEKNK